MSAASDSVKEVKLPSSYAPAPMVSEGAGEVLKVPVACVGEELREVKREVSGELKLLGALTDARGEGEEWKKLQAILVPPALGGDFPEDYYCPITKCLMRDPVSTADGQTYEREAIEAWLVDHNTSPLLHGLISHIFLQQRLKSKSFGFASLPHSWQMGCPL